MALTTVVLAAAGRLQAVLGDRVVNAFERLMGLVLTALAVEMLLNGVRTFVAQLGAEDDVNAARGAGSAAAIDDRDSGGRVGMNKGRATPGLSPPRNGSVSPSPPRTRR